MLPVSYFACINERVETNVGILPPSRTLHTRGEDLCCFHSSSDYAQPSALKQFARLGLDRGQLPRPHKLDAWRCQLLCSLLYTLTTRERIYGVLGFQSGY